MILWFNTGTLRNIASRNCPIESSPRNDRLGYLNAQRSRLPKKTPVDYIRDAAVVANHWESDRTRGSGAG